MPVVDLAYDPDCPNLAAARENLAHAFALLGMEPDWHEHRISDPAAPSRVRGYGSPTILVDGRDVAGSPPEGEACCRLYRGGRVPSVEAIASALRNAR